MSIIDQPPAQSSSYGVSSQATPSAPPLAPPPQQAAWQVFHTAEGRPYYFNAASGTTSWDPPQ